MNVPALIRRAIGRREPVEVLDRADPAGVQERYYTFNDFFRGDNSWYQKALDMVAPTAMDVSKNTAVSTCVNIISQEVASLHVKHWKVGTNGAREIVKNSNPMRVLSRPNEYQTSSDFWLYVIRALLLAGSGTAFVGARNRRDEIEVLHPVPRSIPHASPELGSVYYKLSDFGDSLFEDVDIAKLVPARNVFNPRINCNKHPLIGETPIAAFAYSGAMGSNIQRSAARFHNNMSRPSGVLTTPKPLTQKQLDELKTRWGDATRGDYAGGTPVLHSGLKWEQITMSATDSQMIATYNLSVADIAMAYRIPLYMLGDMSKATFRNVETLFRVFYTGTLRFYLEHLENNLNRLFELDGMSEYLQFDIEEGLLRGDFQSRMTALTKGVQGGILTPNEARKWEQLPPVDGGDNAFLQRQMAPIQNLLAMDSEIIPKGPTDPTTPTTPKEPDKSVDVEDDEDDISGMIMRFNSMVDGIDNKRLAAPAAPPVVNVSTNVDARLDTEQLGAAIRSGLEAMRGHTVNLSPTIVVPTQEPVIRIDCPAPIVNVDAPVINVPTQTPVVNITVPEQRAPVVNVEAPVVNVAVPEQRAPVVNVAVPEQRAPVVNVAVPEQRAPVVNVTVPKQDAPIINVTPSKQAAPIVNVAAPLVQVDVQPADAPIVNVAAPEVHVAAAEVHVPEQPAPVVNVHLPEELDSEQTIERDKQGEITKIVRKKIRRK